MTEKELNKVEINKQNVEVLLKIVLSLLTEEQMKKLEKILNDMKA